MNIYHLPWKPGTIVKVCANQSFDVQVDDKTYHRNTHHLTKRYPRVPISDNDSLMSNGYMMSKESPQRVL